MTRVLLADDHTLVRAGLRKLLESIAGFEVVGEADDGLALLTLVQQQQPDLVLMDMEMPRMSGLDATRAIRDHFSADEMPVIGLTAHGFAASRELCLAAGMNDQLVKPVDFLDLNRSLSRYLAPARPAVPLHWTAGRSCWPRATGWDAG